MKARVFLDRYSPRTIRIAKGSSPALIGNPRIHKFLERLHRDFETVTDRPGSRPPLPGEDVFWWCVGILEQMAEMSRPGCANMPYVRMKLDELRSMGPRLEKREALPPEFQVHWFDSDEFDEEFADCFDPPNDRISGD